MINKNTTHAWDEEYRRKGIPSSVRSEPSGVVLWALANWPYVGDGKFPQTALDVGCGTGRNALRLAEGGTTTVAFDASQVAIDLAKERSGKATYDGSLTFLAHDLQLGLPAEDRSVELVLDIFVYKHQTEAAARASYRADLARVMKPTGLLLLSLAHANDEYYSQCPDLTGKEGAVGAPRRILDPVAGVGSVLFTLQELIQEVSDHFNMVMSWHKTKIGPMHGREFRRETLATLWRLNGTC